MEVDVRLPGKGNSKFHDARPVHLIIAMIKWIRTSRLSIKNSFFSGLTFREETFSRVVDLSKKLARSVLCNTSRMTFPRPDVPHGCEIAWESQRRLWLSVDIT